MSKLDFRLQRQLYLRGTDPSGELEVPVDDAGRPRVFVRFSGDQHDLENAGLHIQSVIGDVAIGSVALDDLERLAELPHVSQVEAVAPTRPLIHESVHDIDASPTDLVPMGLTGHDVIVGIIDSGIDIYHRSFRNEAGSRIYSLWDQTLSAGALGSHTPPYAPPAGYTKGVEFTNDGINNAFAAGAPDFPSKDTDGHGTHVAGIAAGNGLQAGGTGDPDPISCHNANYYIGVAPAAELVIVKTTFDNDDVLLGLEYIFKIAKARVRPAVVNLSLGSDQQSPGRASLFARGVDNCLEPSRPEGLAIVVSAGNNGGDSKEEAFHAHTTIAANATATFDFTMPPGVKTDSSIEIWYDSTSGAQLALTLAAPASPPSTPGGTPPRRTYGPVAYNASYGTVPPSSAGGDVVMAGADGSTARLNGIHITIKGSPITPGPWTITLKEQSGAATEVDLWIAPSHEKDYPQFPAFTKAVRDRKRTITVPATAENVICVGAYSDRDTGDTPTGQLADFSSRGPTVDAQDKPDICAPGVQIYSSKSRGAPAPTCCACCLNTYTLMSGTSQAAPHVTGAVALMLEANATLTYNVIRQLLRDNAAPPPPDPGTGAPVPLPDSGWGYGIIDAAKACRKAGLLVPSPVASVPHHLVDRIPVSPIAFIDTPSRLRALERQLGHYPLWHELAAVASTHSDEVLRLTNTSRHVAVTWHRLGGPHLAGWLLANATAAEPVVLPESFGGRELRLSLNRWLDALARHGSTPLRDDVTRLRPWLLTLPGCPWSSALPLAG